MKLIRFALISFISLFIIITAISLLIPSHVRISRAINIHADPASALAQINDLNKWKAWYPGFDTLQIIPTNSTNGALTAARIASAGTSILITKSDSAEVVAAFNAGKIQPVISGWKAISYNSSDSLTMQWYLDFHLRWYPWEKFLSLTYDKMYGQQMELGLANLKKNVER